MHAALQNLTIAKSDRSKIERRSTVAFCPPAKRLERKKKIVGYNTVQWVHNGQQHQVRLRCLSGKSALTRWNQFFKHPNVVATGGGGSELAAGSPCEFFVMVLHYVENGTFAPNAYFSDEGKTWVPRGKDKYSAKQFIAYTANLKKDQLMTIEKELGFFFPPTVLYTWNRELQHFCWLARFSAKLANNNSFPTHLQVYSDMSAVVLRGFVSNSPWFEAALEGRKCKKGDRVFVIITKPVLRQFSLKKFWDKK